MLGLWFIFPNVASQYIPLRIFHGSSDLYQHQPTTESESSPNSSCGQWTWVLFFFTFERQQATGGECTHSNPLYFANTAFITFLPNKQRWRRQQTTERLRDCPQHYLLNTRDDHRHEDINGPSYVDITTSCGTRRSGQWMSQMGQTNQQTYRLTDCRNY